MGELQHSFRAGVEVKSIPDVLAGLSILEKPLPLCGLAHHDVPAVMRGPDHVCGHEVNQPVVVEIANVCTHRRPRRVRNDLPDNVGECAVPVVAVELVGAKIVI